MSRDSELLWKQMSESFRPVVTGVRSTVNHLKDWTGEYPASVAGAGPAGPAPIPVTPEGEDPAKPPDPVRLTKVESNAMARDGATSKLRLLFKLVDQLVAGMSELGALVDGVRPPAPAHRLEAQVAFVQWQINRARASTGVTWPSGDVKRLARAADQLSRLVTLNAPARTASGVPAGGCVAHARAGMWEALDDRYRRHDLCRRCGEFRHMFGQLPPKRLVQWAEKHGWRSATSAANLAKFGVKGRRPSRTG